MNRLHQTEQSIVQKQTENIQMQGRMGKYD